MKSKIIKVLNLFVSKLAAQAFKFIFVLILSLNILTIENFGMFSLFLSLINIVYLISSFGITDVALYILLNTKTKRKMIGIALIFLVILLIPNFLILSLLLKVFGFTNIFLISLSSSSYIFYIMVKKIAIGIQDFIIMNYLDLIICSFLVGSLFFMNEGENVTKVILIYNFTFYIFTILTVIKLKPKFTLDKTLIREFLGLIKSYGIKIHLSQVISNVTYDLDKYILKFVNGSAILGIYAFALNFINPIKLFSTSLCELFMKDFKEKEYLAKSFFIINFLSTLILSLLGWEVFRFIIQLANKSELLKIIEFKWYIIAVTVLSSLYNPINYYFTAKGYAKQKLKNAIVIGISNVIFYPFFIISAGIQGAFVATIISLSINNIYFYIQYRHIIDRRKSSDKRVFKFL